MIFFVNPSCNHWKKRSADLLGAFLVYDSNTTLSSRPPVYQAMHISYTSVKVDSACQILAEINERGSIIDSTFVFSLNFATPSTYCLMCSVLFSDSYLVCFAKILHAAG